MILISFLFSFIFSNISCKSFNDLFGDRLAFFATMSAVAIYLKIRMEIVVLNAKSGMETKTTSMPTCAMLQSAQSNKCAWE